MINFAVKAAVTVGLMAVQMALGASRKIEGPRLDSLKTTVAEYGTPLDDFYGIRKLSGRPIIWADDLREVKKKSKTKGGKYTEYKYYGSWAVAIAGHEIEAVTRIWFDEHLVYDITGPGPIAAAFLAFAGQGQGAIVKLALGRNMRIYTGTDTQDPDPVIEAWMEDQTDFGANCTSAMRGISYICFNDIPLEKLGNRLPQVTVEAVRTKSLLYPYEQLTGSGSISDRFYFSPSSGWMMLANATGTGYWWDTAHRTLIGSSMTLPVLSGSVPNASISNNGTAWRIGYSTGLDGASVYLFQTQPLSGSSYTAVTGYVSADFICTRVLQNGSETLVYSAYQSSAGYVKGTLHIPHAQSARDFCIDGNGDVAILFQPTGSSSDFTIVCSGGEFTITGSAAARSHPELPAYICHVADHDHFLVVTDGYYYFIDDTTGAVKSSGTAAWGAAVPGNQAQQNPNLDALWSLETGNVVKRSLEDGSVLASYPTTNWAVPGGVGSTAWAYDPLNHAMWINRSSTAKISILYLDRVGNGGVTLGTIVETESDQVNCDVDASALDQLVDGVSFGPGPVKDRISPLLDLHDSKVRIHDFGVEGIKRGTVSQDTIPTERFTRDGNESRYDVEIAQDNDLPQRLEVKFATLNNDQELNNVIAFRHTQAVDTSRVQQIDMSTYADTPDAMQKKADRFLRRIWNSRATVKNGLTAQYLAAEPGDLYDLDLDGVEWTCELEKVTLLAKQPAMKCEWRRTFPSLANLGEGTAPDTDGRTPDIIIIPSQTKGFVLDVPYLQDADNDINPTLYVAAGKYSGTWTGAVAWEGSDGTYDDDVVGFDSSQGAAWGYTSDALANANPNLWDRGNTFEVVVLGGTLSSSTEAAINADESINQAAIGAEGRWEIINFTTVTLTASTTYTRTYTISGLLRGRRGTEMNTGNHAAGDGFVLLDEAKSAQLGTDLIGDDLSFKVQSVGLDPDAAPAIDLAPYTAASLKPYAPIIWHVEKDDATGDISIELRSRTRYGANWNGSTIPTGESSESYEFDVYDGVTFKRTLTSTTKTFNYTAAQQTTDFGSDITAADLEGNAYQLSATVGRGFARAA